MPSSLDAPWERRVVESSRRRGVNAVRLGSFALSLSKGEWASTGSARTANRTVLRRGVADSKRRLNRDRGLCAVLRFRRL